MVVGSWGANSSYGANMHVNNQGQEFIRRNPLFPLPTAQSSTARVTSLMGQMRISPGHKLPTNRHGPHSGNQFNQRRAKNQKKNITKKNSTGAISTNAETSTSVANAIESVAVAAPTTSSTAKAKVSFRDEASIGKIIRSEDGSGDARIMTEKLAFGQALLEGAQQKPGEVTESSHMGQLQQST